jgi:hypothetical protein
LHSTPLNERPTDIVTDFEVEQPNRGRFGPANATDEAKTNMESEKNVQR